MKILLLAAANDIHTVRWANQLSDNGNEVHLCYLSNQKPSKDKFSKNVILHKLLIPSPYGYYLNIFQLKMLLLKIQPDIFNVHYASGYGTLGRLAKFSPYILSVYGSDVYDFPYKSKYNMNIIKKNLSAADEIASTSKAMAKQVTELIDLPISKIYITPFGVDTDRFKKNLNKEVDDEIIIGSIKKLAPKYGIKYGILAIDYLLNTILKNENEHIDIKYYIYGDGNEKAELELLVREKKLQESVHFKGLIPNNLVPNALNEMDIFVGTSVLDSESFGVAIVEAMSCEIPVIVTDVDGFKEVVDGGRCGIMVPREDYVKIAEEIYELLGNESKMTTLGKLQRERVIKMYNWKKNVKEMEKIYKEICSVKQ